MSTPEQDAQAARQKRTILLLAGGAVSLALPLLGVIYLRLTEAKAARGPSSVTFDRRENGESKINVSQTVAILNPAPRAGATASSLPVAGVAKKAPAGASSLDFVSGGANNTYYQDPPAAAPAPLKPVVEAPVAPPADPPPVKTVARKGKKAFAMPKLQGTRGFSSFKGASPRTPGKGTTAVADPQAGGDMTDMLKDVPGGINNPEVQKYLKSQGK